MLPSVTNMNLCTHGPKKDCHACLVGELVDVMGQLLGASEDLFYLEAKGDSSLKVALAESRMAEAQDVVRTLIKKAKLLEDCIPIEEAEEASRL